MAENMERLMVMTMVVERENMGYLNTLKFNMGFSSFNWRMIKQNKATRPIASPPYTRRSDQPLSPAEPTLYKIPPKPRVERTRERLSRLISPFSLLSRKTNQATTQTKMAMGATRRKMTGQW